MKDGHPTRTRPQTRPQTRPRPPGTPAQRATPPQDQTSADRSLPVIRPTGASALALRDRLARHRLRPKTPLEISEAMILPKAVFDRTVAAVGLVLLLPLMLTVAALIWRNDPGPVLFAHRRIGRHGRVFNCLKFRTMVTDADTVLARHLGRDPQAAREWAETRKLRNDPRVTPLGARLRRTSLDELPQLINVLRGEMSLVGPRPIVADEAPHYGEAMALYLSVRPGVTGLWQVSGRSDTAYPERVALDRHYVAQRNLRLDIAILLRTVSVVLRGRGSY